MLITSPGFGAGSSGLHSPTSATPLTCRWWISSITRAREPISIIRSGSRSFSVSLADGIESNRKNSSATIFSPLFLGFPRKPKNIATPHRHVKVGWLERMLQFSISLHTGRSSLGVKLPIAALTAMGSGTRFLGHQLPRQSNLILEDTRSLPSRQAGQGRRRGGEKAQIQMGSDRTSLETIY